MKPTTARTVSVGLVVTAWGMAIASSGFATLDGATAREAFLLAAEATGIYVVFLIGRVASPRGFRVEPFERVFDILQVIVLAMLLIPFAVGHIGVASTVARPLVAGLGLMMAGNLMSKLRRNFFVGVRTPWTLASEEVWLQTHRFGSKTTVVAGLYILIAGSLGLPPTLLVAAMLATLSLNVGYSYFAYRRLEGFAEPFLSDDGS